MSELYENLLKATDNTNDITNEKYGTVTKINGALCSVLEEDTNLEHTNVPVLNQIYLETGDKVVIGFVDNSIYNPIIVGNLTRGIRLSTEDIIEPSSLNNLELPANSSQHQINLKVNEKINRLMDMLQVYEDLYVFLDYGVTGSKNSDWYVRSTDAPYVSVTVDDDGTTLSSNDTLSSRFYFANPEHIISSSPTITISDFVVECDVISTTISNAQVNLYLQGMGTNFVLSSYTAPYHLKMEKVGTTVKQYVDDTLIRETTINDSTTYVLGFQLYHGGSIKFKNYRIYSK